MMLFFFWPLQLSACRLAVVLLRPRRANKKSSKLTTVFAPLPVSLASSITKFTCTGLAVWGCGHHLLQINLPPSPLLDSLSSGRNICSTASESTAVKTSETSSAQIPQQPLPPRPLRREGAHNIFLPSLSHPSKHISFSSSLHVH